MPRNPEPPGPEESTPAEGQNHDNRLDSGRIVGDVVQARDVHGGIHLNLDPSSPGSASFNVIPRQLPSDPRGFVNREREIAELGEMSGTERRDDAAIQAPSGTVVVIITGSAGVGKTALALHWAHRIRHLFDD